MEKDVELCERPATEDEQREKSNSLNEKKCKKEVVSMIGLDDDDETYSVPSF